MESANADGAAAAGTYFAQVYAFSWATGDLSLWMSMSGPACELCTRIADDIEAMKAVGNYSTSAPVDVVRADGTEIDPGRWYSADLEIVQGPSQVKAPDGTLVSDNEGGPARFFLALAWLDGRWQIEAADFLPSELSS